MIEIRAEDVTALPWTNGEGQTRELLARPEGPGWAIRVSIAEIGRRRAGPRLQPDGPGRLGGDEDRPVWGGVVRIAPLL